MNDLRDLAENNRDFAYSEDTYSAMLPLPDGGQFLVLCWYKRRGRTGTALIIDSDGVYEPLTLAEAEELLK